MLARRTFARLAATHPVAICGRFDSEATAIPSGTRWLSYCAVAATPIVSAAVPIVDWCRLSPTFLTVNPTDPRSQIPFGRAGGRDRSSEQQTGCARRSISPTRAMQIAFQPQYHRQERLAEREFAGTAALTRGLEKLNELLRMLGQISEDRPPLLSIAQTDPVSGYKHCRPVEASDVWLGISAGILAIASGLFCANSASYNVTFVVVQCVVLLTRCQHARSDLRISISHGHLRDGDRPGDSRRRRQRDGHRR